MTGFRAHTFKTTAERLFTNICLGKKKEPEYKHSSGPNSMASPVVVLFLLTALFAIPPGSEYLQFFFFLDNTIVPYICASKQQDM